MGKREDDGREERWRKGAAEFLVCVRSDALRAGASPFKVWEQVASRAMSAARRVETIQGWCSEVMRGMQVPTPSRWTAAAADALVTSVWRDADLFFDILEQETGYIIAVAQLIAEERRDARKEEAK